jgi:hypothetical protein
VSDLGEPPDSAYTSALRDAEQQQARVLMRAYCDLHRTEIAVVRDTPHGALFAADVPVEREVGLGEWVSEVRHLTGKRTPTPRAQVRYLVEHPENEWHRGALVAWCSGCRARLEIDRPELTRWVSECRRTGRFRRMIVSPAHSV